MPDKTTLPTQLEQLSQYLTLSEAEMLALLQESRAEALAEVKSKLRQQLTADMLAQLNTHITKEEAWQKPDMVSLKQEIETIEKEIEALQNLKQASKTTLSPQNEPKSVHSEAGLDGASYQNTASSPPPKEAYYSYGIISATENLDFLENLDSLVPTYPLESVTHGNLQAIVSKVPWTEFGTAALNENLHNQQWLSDRVRRNQQILQHILQHTTLIPMRFCTIFYTPADIETLLREQADSLTAQLNFLHHRQEWGVKIFADTNTLKTNLLQNQANLRSEQTQMNQVSNGTAYFMRKKLKNNLNTALQTLTHQLATDSHTALSQVAVASTTLALQSHHTKPLILNAAYLIDETALNTFTSTLDELAGTHHPTGLQYELSGPWPPFNFVGFPDPAQQTAPNHTESKETA